AVIALLERDQPSIRSDVKAGRLVLAEYRESASAQLEFWRARMRAALKHGLSRAHVVGDVSAGALGGLPFGEILEYEGGYDRFIAGAFPVATLCQYGARG